MENKTAKSGLGFVWAESWLREVQEANRALERAEMIARAKEERAYSLKSPMAGAGQIRGKGGVSNPMAAIEEKMAADEEAATDPLYAWARETLGEFERMKCELRPCLRNTFALGLDACELRYRCGLTVPAVADSLNCGQTTVKTAMRAFIDYLDFIGKARAVPPPSYVGTE